MLGLVGAHGEYPIERMRLSNDANTLASASHDHTVKIWDISFLHEEDDGDDAEENEEEIEQEEVERKLKRKKKGRGKKKLPGRETIDAFKKKEIASFFKAL